MPTRTITGDQGFGEYHSGFDPQGGGPYDTYDLTTATFRINYQGGTASDYPFRVTTTPGGVVTILGGHFIGNIPDSLSWGQFYVNDGFNSALMLLQIPNVVVDGPTFNSEGDTDKGFVDGIRWQAQTGTLEARNIVAWNGRDDFIELDGSTGTALIEDFEVWDTFGFLSMTECSPGQLTITIRRGLVSHKIPPYPYERNDADFNQGETFKSDGTQSATLICEDLHVRCNPSWLGHTNYNRLTAALAQMTSTRCAVYSIGGPLHATPKAAYLAAGWTVYEDDGDTEATDAWAATVAGWNAPPAPAVPAGITNVVSIGTSSGTLATDTDKAFDSATVTVTATDGVTVDSEPVSVRVQAVADPYAVSGVSPTHVADFTGDTFRSAGADSDFDTMIAYSGPSLRTVIDENGTSRFTSHNLTKNSENVQGSGWKLLTGAEALSVDTVRLVGVNSRFEQFIVSPANVDCVFAVEARTVAGAETADVAVRITDGNLISTLTREWQSFQVTRTSGNGFHDPQISLQQDTDVSIQFRNWSFYVNGMQSLGGSFYIPTPLATPVYLPRRHHHRWSGAAWVDRGLLIEPQRTNLILGSAAPATQNVSVTAQAYTLHFTGTGSITLSGAHSATLTGAGAGEQNRVSLTFTPSAGTLTLTVSGTVTAVQLEAGSGRTTVVPTTTATTTRATETASFTLPSGTHDIRVEDEAGTTDFKGVSHAGGAYWPAHTGAVARIRAFPAGTLP